MDEINQIFTIAGMARIKNPERRKTFMRQWRKYRRMTQEAAAFEVGIDRTTLGRIERGLLPYNQDLIERLAAIYGCEPADILGMNPLVPREVDILANFRQASPERKAIVMDILRRAG